MTRRQRRARRRWDIQRARKHRRNGRCPCGDVRIIDPGPHLATCPWADPSYPPFLPF